MTVEVTRYRMRVFSGVRGRVLRVRLRFRVWRGRYRVHRYTGIPMRELRHLQRDINAEIERRFIFGELDG